MTRGLIVSGGHVNHDLLLKVLKSPYDQIIAVDGGMNPLWVLGVNPDVLLGDFDSCKSLPLAHYRQEGIKEITFSKQKDMTDTELALVEAIRMGLDQVVVVGATGTRLDHTLANMMVALKYKHELDVVLLDATNKIFPAKSGLEIGKEHYKYLSLQPMTEFVTNVTLEGVAYPLKEATLVRNSSYAVSNEIVSESCYLTFDAGEMLVIQSID